jgi:hypothetical protein
MFLSSQTAQDQFTAENATLNEDHHEDTKRKLWHLFITNFLLLFFTSILFVIRCWVNSYEFVKERKVGKAPKRLNEIRKKVMRYFL